MIGVAGIAHGRPVIGVERRQLSFNAGQLDRGLVGCIGRRRAKPAQFASQVVDAIQQRPAIAGAGGRDGASSRKTIGAQRFPFALV